MFLIQSKFEKKETMSNNYNVSNSNFRYRSHIFKFSFLVFQLVFCSMLIFYILKKSEFGINLLERFF
jgi:ABC-type uncharacterized transport system permease subunit